MLAILTQNLFQSLLSQGISLLRLDGIMEDINAVNGFNPFLVRASVYCLTQMEMAVQAAPWVSIPS